MMTAEQIMSAHKANVETLFGLTGLAFEGVEKLVELNIQVAKAAMSEASDTTKAALSVKDAQELMALQASLLQPAAEKAAAYGRHVYEIAASTGAACHADSVELSPVLAAMGVPPIVGMGAVRLSLGRMTTEAEIDEVLDRVGRVAAAEVGAFRGAG